MNIRGWRAYFYYSNC